MGMGSSKRKTPARLDGKTAIITGCNTGIGKVTALTLCSVGARVIMACRDVQRAEEAAAEIRAKISNTPEAGVVVVRQLDLGHMQSIRECAQQILDDEPAIHLLINNAGVMMCPKTLTADGLEMQFGVNHIGHFLLTNLLLPRIIKSAPARIINVSSRAHEQGRIEFEDLNSEKSYGPLKAYQQSKLANILFTTELARRLEGTGVTTYALHPGVVKTDLGRHLDESYFRGLRTMFRLMAWPFMKTPEQGAQTTIYCATDEQTGNETGLYYSDCKVKRPSARAQDPEAAERLWEESVKICNLGDYDPFKAVESSTVNSNSPKN